MSSYLYSLGNALGVTHSTVPPTETEATSTPPIAESSAPPTSSAAPVPPSVHPAAISGPSSSASMAASAAPLPVAEPTYSPAPAPAPAPTPAAPSLSTSASPVNLTSTPTVASTSSSTSAGRPVTSIQSTIVSTAPVSGAEPVKALDIVAEPTILEQAQAMAKPYLNKVEATTKPYVDKVQQTTKPYTDAATAKVQGLVDRMDGKTSTPPTTAPSTATSDKSFSGLSGVSMAVGGNRRASVTQETMDKAKGMLAAVQSGIAQLTTTIDEKTKSPTHPGIITQVQHAIEKGVTKVDAMMNDLPAGTVTGHPVQTTTNSVAHTSTAPDPATATSNPTGAPTGLASLSTAGASFVPPP